MKKMFLLLLVVFMTLSIVSCVTNDTGSTGTTNPEANKGQPTIIYSNMEDIKTIMAENDNYIIVDVRTAEEYQEGHIPGAINIPNEDIVDVMPSELPDKEQLILIYCRSGNRSKQAAQKLLDMGYTNLVEFGGIIDWTEDTVTGEYPYAALLQLRLPMPDVLRIELPKLLGNNK